MDGAGWIPVDASEAWKNPAKRDYFFAAHDDNRVFFTYGRDIVLSPLQRGAPLNYFSNPYAEADDQPVKGLATHFLLPRYQKSVIRDQQLSETG